MTPTPNKPPTWRTASTFYGEILGLSDTTPEEDAKLDALTGLCRLLGLHYKIEPANQPGKEWFTVSVQEPSWPVHFFAPCKRGAGQTSVCVPRHDVVFSLQRAIAGAYAQVVRSANHWAHGYNEWWKIITGRNYDGHAPEPKPWALPVLTSYVEERLRSGEFQPLTAYQAPIPPESGPITVLEEIGTANIIHGGETHFVANATDPEPIEEPEPEEWRNFEEGCRCHTAPPCNFCLSLTEKQTDAFASGGMEALERLSRGESV